MTRYHGRVAAFVLLTLWLGWQIAHFQASSAAWFWLAVTLSFYGALAVQVFWPNHKHHRA